jgi:prepilin-type N-terminal cleavage/methylation domain-containing protein
MSLINNMKKQKGFTLIEILVVIGIIAILATIVIIAINPARQFAQARNSQRISNVNAILNAIGQNIADNKGLFNCPSYTLTTTATVIGNVAGANANIRPCIVATYMPEITGDPTTGVNTCVDTVAGDCAVSGNYNTHYDVSQNTVGRVKVCAPGGVEPAIAGSAAICVER